MTKFSLLIIPLLFFPSCSTSSDPREGGLFGYWATGESGYQARVDNMQGQLNEVESSNVAEARRSSSLNSRKASLQSQKSRLNSLEVQARSSSGNSALVSRIQKTERGADSDPDLDAKVRQLEAEVNALKAAR